MAFLGRPSERDDPRERAWRDWLRRQNLLAVASLVLGVLSLIEFGALIVLGVAGIVLGFVALAQIRRVVAEVLGSAGSGPDAAVGDDAETPVPRTSGRGLAWAGIVCSVLSLVVAFVLYTKAWLWFADRAAAGGGGAA